MMMIDDDDILWHIRGTRALQMLNLSQILHFFTPVQAKKGYVKCLGESL